MYSYSNRDYNFRQTIAVVILEEHGPTVNLRTLVNLIPAAVIILGETVSSYIGREY